MIRTFLFLLVAFVAAGYVSAQSESQLDLPYNAELIHRAEQAKSFAHRNSGDRMVLTLPFLDDFDRYSLPTSDPTIPLGWQMWSDSLAYINNTYPILPPTIGVATLDGLKADGTAYNETLYSYGPADTLTSLPIDLSSYTAESNVFLIFQYEGGGLGNQPEEMDSLIVDFYTTVGVDGWYRQWATGGALARADSFYRAVIPINQPEYLTSNFQFRFRNYASLYGNYDHWHLDFVLINSGLDTSITTYSEVAMQYPNNTLLNNYTAMPWPHYRSNPSFFMRDEITAYERNLQPVSANIVTGYQIKYQDQLWDFPGQDFNITSNANQNIERTIPLNGYQFDDTVNDTCAVFDVKVYINTINDPYNDTAQFKQVFSNYYAYDDGSAEWSYSLTDAPGGSTAMKFTSAIPDTLLGLLIQFVPYGISAATESFLLRVYGDNNGSPGNQFQENFNQFNPQFFRGLNQFSYYPLDAPLFVSGVFYVGFTHPGTGVLSVGLDKNTNANNGNLFYMLQNGGTWLPSEIQGSVMIRPVFRAAKQIVGIGEVSEPQALLYPNPSNGNLNIALTQRGSYQIHIYDSLGREVLTETANDQIAIRMDISSLPAGIYQLTLTDKDNRRRSSQLLIRE